MANPTMANPTTTARDRLINKLRKDLLADGLIARDTKPLWPAPYDEATPEAACKFIFERVRTVEETALEPMSIADMEYLRTLADEWYRAVESGGKLHIVKSRRLIVSWVLGALELHYMGVKAKRLFVAARTFEGAGGSRHFVWRAARMYELLRQNNPDWSLPPFTKSGPALEHDYVALENGSTLTALNSDSEKMRGSGAGMVRFEELSAHGDNASSLMSQGQIITQGPPGVTGGAIVSVSNAANNKSWLQMIARPGCAGSPILLEERFLLSPAKPVESHSNSQGDRVLRIHYRADPLKDDDWVAANRRAMSNVDWAREMEGDITAVAGKPVYPEYIDAFHCPEETRGLTFRVHPQAVLIGCWDCSTATTHLAFCLIQIVPPLNQIQAVFEMETSTAKMGEFVMAVNSELRARVGGARVIHFGDPAGRARAATGKPAFAVAEEHGVSIEAGPIGLHDRLSAVAWALNDIIESGDEQYPRFVVSSAGCPILRMGFQGAYKLREVTVDGGKITREPLKNEFSHIQDSLQYGMPYARKIINALRIDNHTPKKASRPDFRVNWQVAGKDNSRGGTATNA